MGQIKKYCILLIVLLFHIGGAYAYANSNKILIISSYGTDYQWSNSIIDGINIQMKASHPGVELNVEYLTSERFTSTEQWISKMDTLLCKYKNNIPKAIILISDEAWMAYRETNHCTFKDIPLLLCAVKPHSISIEEYNKNYSSLRLDNFRKTLDVMKEHNATGVLREMNTSGYIELMKETILNLDRFTLITDNRFYGIYTRLLFEKEVHSNYPEYSTTFIDARFANTDTLLEELPHITPNTGVLLTSWLTGEHGFTYSKNYVYKEMTAKTHAPIFITTDIGLDKGWFIGGYFNEAIFWGEAIGSMLTDLSKGISPTDIAPQIYRDEQCNINHEVLSKFKLSKKNLPEDTHYINVPLSMFERYRVETILVITLFILIIVSAIYILNSNIKLKRAQRQILKSVEEADTANQELVKTKENLILALEKAKTADVLKSSFVANMGNQIRNPLNAIVGFSNLISTMENTAEREEMAMLIKQNSDALFHLITSILDISQLESKSVTFCKESIYLNAFCEDMINAHKSMCTEGLTLVFTPPQEVLSIQSDPQRLAQALSSLLSNAIRFTPQGTIEVGYFLYNDTQIEFYVKDTGIGIAPYNLDVIFDSFVKINPYTAGAGLGLTIAKNILEIFGGEIGVTSTLNEGSRFWFRINK